MGKGEDVLMNLSGVPELLRFCVKAIPVHRVNKAQKLGRFTSRWRNLEAVREVRETMSVLCSMEYPRL